MNLKEELFKNEDLKYRDWIGINAKELPRIGVRVPIIKNIAKEIIKNKEFDILKEESTYFEEELTKTFVIAMRKHNSFDEIKNDLEFWISHINSWDLNDTLCQHMKDVKKYKKEVFDYLEKYINSNKEFEVRVCVVMYLCYFLDDEYIDKVLSNILKFKNDEFYAKMGIAWCIATAFAKVPDKTLEWFKTCDLDEWTYNKSIQKACESFRVDENLKKILKSLKK